MPRTRYARNQVGLELVQVDIEGTIETQGSSDRGDNLSDETVEVGEAWGSDVETLLANVVNSLVVDHERAVGMLQGGVSRQNRVVRFNDGVGHRWGGVHAELELRLLAVVVGKALHEQRAEAGTSSTAKRVEDEEALETRAVIRKAADFVHDGVNELLADSVVTTGICRATLRMRVERPT